MKTRQIEEILRNRGSEQGVKYVLEAINEDVQMLKKSILDMATLQNQIIDSLNNVVEGAGMMRSELINTMKKAGLVQSEENDDGLGPSTQSIDDYTRKN